MGRYMFFYLVAKVGQMKKKYQLPFCLTTDLSILP